MRLAGGLGLAASISSLDAITDSFGPDLEVPSERAGGGKQTNWFRVMNKMIQGRRACFMTAFETFCEPEMRKRKVRRKSYSATF
jgi:hypothetical protein